MTDYSRFQIYATDLDFDLDCLDCNASLRASSARTLQDLMNLADEHVRKHHGEPSLGTVLESRPGRTMRTSAASFYRWRCTRPTCADMSTWTRQRDTATTGRDRHEAAHREQEGAIHTSA